MLFCTNELSAGGSGSGDRVKAKLPELWRHTGLRGPLAPDQFTGTGNHGGSKTISAPVNSSTSLHIMLSPRRELGSTHLNVRLSFRIRQKATRASRVSTSRTGPLNKIPRVSDFVASAILIIESNPACFISPELTGNVINGIVSSVALKASGILTLKFLCVFRANV